MSFDNSRYIFNPWNNYSSVVMPQGRVQLDADWNEWLAEIARRIQAGTIDTMGRAVYPLTTPNAFYISGSSAPSAISIGLGRMYVDGLLAENHGALTSATPWDPALAELSGAPQPAPTSVGPTANDTPYASQPYLPGATLPSGAGPYLFYLDVWTRAVTWLQDPDMVDKAVGVDTSGRLQTVWQVRWLDASLASSVTSGTTTPISCGTPDSSIVYPSQSYGLLMNGVVPNAASGPCCLSDGSGYTGVENQFYRVEIHQGGPLGKATFKWSKENASVITSVTAIQSLANAAKTMVTVLTVASLGRDQVLGFNNGDWIELTTDNIELAGMPDPALDNPYGSPGLLCQIDHVEPATNQVYLTAAIDTSSYPGNQFGLTSAPSANMRIRRWDQSSAVNTVQTTSPYTQAAYSMPGFAGDIPVPAAGTTLVLEAGITVAFSVGNGGTTFNSGDFWTFAARTFDGTLDPQYPFPQPPRGIHHHYTGLSVVTFNESGDSISNPDCRKAWPPNSGGDCGCCTVTVGDGQTSFGQYNSIQQAINSLKMPQGGEVCILPGTYYENVLIQGMSQIKLRGAGPQTVWNPYSAAPTSGTYDEGGANNPANNLTTSSGLSAILTISGSQRIDVSSLTMQATNGTSCVLLDPTVTSAETVTYRKRMAETKEGLEYVPRQGTEQTVETEGSSFGVKLPYQPGYYHPGNGIPVTPGFTPSSTEVCLSDLVLAASTRPAITAVQAVALTVCDNRMLMKNVASEWPAIYVSGDEIVIKNNWVGLDDSSDAETEAPTTMADAEGSPISAKVPTAWTGNGGIQIGGFSTGIEILNNRIEGGAFNGISLGGILRLQDAVASGGLNGLFFSSAAGVKKGTTLVLPASNGNYQLGADGPLQDILIQGNTITSTGLCGIGPVGYFPLATRPEVVSIGNLRILGNTIRSTLQATLTPFSAKVGFLGYGAICLPDLQGVVVRDNVVTDFGQVAGAQVCGIYLLNAEQAEISRNQVIESRDWAAIPKAEHEINGDRAGIFIRTVSPPALDQSATATAWTGASTQGVTSSSKFKTPLYQPGLPALTLEGNVVRMAKGESLRITGYGPFSISGNHFSTGGTAKGNSDDLALNVAIMNMGFPVEVDKITTYSQLYKDLTGKSAATVLQGVDKALQNSTNGSVLFTNNICQTELRASGATGLANILIMTFDHLNVSNNVTWMDGNAIGEPDSLQVAALMDVMLFGITTQVLGNRFQESFGSVALSGITIGLLNMTAQNISTWCLYTIPASASINNQTSIQALANAGSGDGQGDDICGNGSRLFSGDAGMPGSQTYMKVASDSIGANPSAKLTSMMTQADTYSSTQVKQLSVVHEARLSQVNRIATLVAKQPNVSPTILAASRTAVTNTKAVTARVLMMKAQMSSTAPTVAAPGWALYGHVYNSTGAGLDACSVYFVDASNTYQSACGIAYTSTDGSYRIVNAGTADGQSTPQLFLQIGNSAGEPVYTSPTAFTPAPGAATYQDVTLPADFKFIGKLPTVLRNVVLPPAEKQVTTVTESVKAEEKKD